MTKIRNHKRTEQQITVFSTKLRCYLADINSLIWKQSLTIYEGYFDHEW